MKNFALAVLACVSAVACRTSHADTLTLKSLTGSVDAGAYVYPYNMSVNNSTATTPMMCINYNDEVTLGESWQVTSTVMSSSMSAALQEDAWLFSMIGTSSYSITDIQFAAWYILDPSDVSKSSGYTTTAQKLVAMAGQTQPGLSNSFLSKYTLYQPVLSASSTWTAGVPQSYIALDPIAVTPEPSSLLLLGTGLLGAAFVMTRRRAMAL